MHASGEGDSKAGQAEEVGRGERREGDETGEETMKEREFIGQRPRQGISREKSQSLVGPSQRF